MRVSVIIPAFNAEKTIIRALESLENQNFSDFEIIVIDDGSCDETWKIIDEYKRSCTKKITAIRQENSGVSNARNRGIAVATGKYVMFLDADDEYSRDAISVMVEAMEEKKVDIVFSRYSRKKTDSHETEKYNIQVLNHEQMMLKWMYNAPPLLFCTAIYKKEILDSNKVVFNTKYSFGEDLMFTWNYLSYACNCGDVNKTTYIYYDEPTSAVHSTNWNRVELLESTREIFEGLCAKNEIIASKFIEYMYPRAMWAVARTFSQGGRYDLLRQLEEMYSLKSNLRKLIRVLMFDSKEYKGDFAKKGVLILTSIVYLINPKLFYFFVRMS